DVAGRPPVTVLLDQLRQLAELGNTENGTGRLAPARPCRDPIDLGTLGQRLFEFGALTFCPLHELGANGVSRALPPGLCIGVLANVVDLEAEIRTDLLGAGRLYLCGLQPRLDRWTRVFLGLACACGFGCLARVGRVGVLE